MDVAGAQYAEVENVDLEQTVSKFIARWVAQAKLDVDPSLVTLRLVKCGARKPEPDEEANAALLDDPRKTLEAAGVTDGCNLLAFVAGARLCTPALLVLGLLAPTRRFTCLGHRARRVVLQWPFL